MQIFDVQDIGYEGPVKGSLNPQQSCDPHTLIEVKLGKQQIQSNNGTLEEKDLIFRSFWMI